MLKRLLSPAMEYGLSIMVIDLRLPLLTPRNPCVMIPTLHSIRTATRRVNVFDALSCMSPWPFLTLQHLLVFPPSGIGILVSLYATVCQFLINTFAMAVLAIISKAKVVIPV